MPRFQEHSGKAAEKGRDLAWRPEDGATELQWGRSSQGRVVVDSYWTYKSPPSKVPRLDLWDPYLFLTRLHAARKDLQKVVLLALKVLDSLGFIINGGHIPSQPNSPFEVMQWGLMVDSVIETWVHLWTAYATVAPEWSEKAEGYAKMAYRICIGEDVTFEESYGKMPERQYVDIELWGEALGTILG
jgi:hypothetical protein